MRGGRVGRQTVHCCRKVAGSEGPCMTLAVIMIDESVVLDNPQLLMGWESNSEICVQLLTMFRICNDV